MAKEAPAMSGDDFVAWMDAMRFTWRETQERLGIGTRSTITKYRTQGAPIAIALACSAIAADLPPWSPTLG